MKDYRGLKGFLAGVVVTACVGVCGYSLAENTNIFQGESVEETQEDSGITSETNLKKLKYIEKLIQNNYLNEIDEEALADGMFAGLLEGLGDPYSCYYTKEEYDEMTEETSGKYKGIGVVMQEDENGLVHFVRIYEGAPGEKAGLKAGDILYKVDGEEVTGMELSLVAKKIKDTDKDTTKLTIARDGEDDYLEFEIVKEEVQIPVVSYQMLDQKVGYLAIYEFTSVTYEQYQNAWNDLEAQGMESLIVDLRDNPGGLLNSVCDILNTILPEGIIVYTEDKYGNRQEENCDGKSPISIPLAVLVNGNSASASEIFSGAVKDYGIGTIVGTTTYGKGVVQSVKELSDGSAIKLTISNYYTPLGNNIHGKGITPDVEVELSEEAKESYSMENDNQLQEAIKVVTQE